MSDTLRNSHPGQLLRQEFLEPLGITPYRLARSISVPLTRITAILEGKRGITADTAARFGRFFGTSAQFWLNLQTTYELRQARSGYLDSELAKIEPWPRPDLEPAGAP